MGLRSVRQPRNCHVLLMEASWPKATHYLTLTHSAAADSDSSASLCLNCKHEDEDDGRPYAPTPGLLPAACGAAGPHQFLHNGTRLVPPWTPLFLLEPSGQCLLLLAADMHSSDLATHTLFSAHSTQFKMQSMPAAWGAKYFPVTADRACHPG